MAPPKMLYQLKITLFDTQPKIWRRILIPTSVTFWELHSAIQDVFHWNHTHLHQFHYEDKILRKPLWFGIPTDEDDMYNVEIYPSWKHKISKYLNLEEPNLKYVYDLSDNWMHLIELENILPAEKGTAYPICIGGKRNSPPDDCGGTHGYEEMLGVLSDPSDEEYEGTKERVDSITGGTFDPAHFDPAEVRFMDPKQRYKESFE
jgi:hypothetical protein